MKLPVADCQLPIAGSAPRRCFARGRHDGRQIIRFLKQGGKLGGFDRSGFSKQLKPKGSFVRFFLDCPNFCDEFGFASSSAGCPVVRRHGRATTDNLFGNDTSGVVSLGNTFRQFNDAKRETFGPLFQFGRVHARKLLNQLAIANRKSPINK